MTNIQSSDEVNGKTLRLSWTDGPTKGTAQDHVFHHDGTVEWHSVKAGNRSEARHTDAEKPAYVDEKVADGVRMVSYLSQSGYTLTVVLNFADGSTVGVASNEKTWTPVHGRFEVIR
jgi:MoaF N-terminal domain